MFYFLNFYSYREYSRKKTIGFNSFNFFNFFNFFNSKGKKIRLEGLCGA